VSAQSNSDATPGPEAPSPIQQPDIDPDCQCAANTSGTAVDQETFPASDARTWTPVGGGGAPPDSQRDEQTATCSGPAAHRLLQKVRFFEFLSDEHLLKIAAIATVEFKITGNILFHEGDTSDHVFFIADGAVTLDMHVPLRGRIRVLTLGSGDFFTWSPLLSVQPATVTATVLEDAILVSLPARPLRDLCDRDHEIGYPVMQCFAFALSDRLLATRLQLLDLFRETQPVLT
jgi:CRP/FNR family cyclic AMP-dependent transcriptional regulator